MTNDNLEHLVLRLQQVGVRVVQLDMHQELMDKITVINVQQVPIKIQLDQLRVNHVMLEHLVLRLQQLSVRVVQLDMHQELMDKIIAIYVEMVTTKIQLDQLFVNHVTPGHLVLQMEQLHAPIVQLAMLAQVLVILDVIFVP